MRFLVDRCAGRRIASWLQEAGHDVAEVVGPDPGDLDLLERAAREDRILITLDRHFSQLIFHHSRAHRGLVRLPRGRSWKRSTASLSTRRWEPSRETCHLLVGNRHWLCGHHRIIYRIDSELLWILRIWDARNRRAACGLRSAR